MNIDIDQMLRTGALMGPYRPVRAMGMSPWARMRRNLRCLVWRMRGL